MPKLAPSASVECLPERFSAGMNAATSRFGFLCDITLTFVALGIVGLLTAAAFASLPWLPGWAALVPLTIPILVNLAALLALRHGRRDVVRWLLQVPFPVENVNAVLCGSGEFFEVFFEGSMPDRGALMGYLERASEDAYVIELDEDRHVMSARFGIVESKFNPYREAHRRFVRMKSVVDRALVPLHQSHPIARVLVV
jgi:hypothetical protein